MSNEIMTLENNDIVSGLMNSNDEVYTSFMAETHEDKIRLYNAMSGDGLTVKSAINKTINLKDCIVMSVDVINDDGGTSTVPRVILVDDKGETYNATSWGVYNSIKKIQAIFGSLHFEDPLKVVPVEVKTKNGFTINLKVV